MKAKLGQLKGKIFRDLLLFCLRDCEHQKRTQNEKIRQQNYQGQWVLGWGDVHGTTGVSEQNQTASDVSTKASDWKGNGSKQDQDGSRSDNSSPAARNQNNVCVCAVTPAVRDQNNEFVCGLRGMLREYNKENTRDDHDQNNNKETGTRDECGGKHNTQMTKMTYREALVGVDKAEPCSDF